MSEQHRPSSDGFTLVSRSTRRSLKAQEALAAERLATCHVLNRLASSVLRFRTQYFEVFSFENPSSSDPIHLACEHLASATVALQYANCHAVYPMHDTLLRSRKVQSESRDMNVLNQLAHHVKQFDTTYFEVFKPVPHLVTSDDRSSLAELNRLAKVAEIVGTRSFDGFYPVYTPFAYTATSGFVSKATRRLSKENLLRHLHLDSTSSFSQAFPNTYLDITTCSMINGHVSVPKNFFDKMFAFKCLQAREYLNVVKTPRQVASSISVHINLHLRAWFKTLALNTLSAISKSKASTLKSMNAKYDKSRSKTSKKSKNPTQPQDPQPSGIPDLADTFETSVPLEPVVEEFDLTVDSESPDLTLSPNDAAALVRSDPEQSTVASIFTDRSTSGRDLYDLRHSISVLVARTTLLTTSVRFPNQDLSVDAVPVFTVTKEIKGSARCSHGFNAFSPSSSHPHAQCPEFNPTPANVTTGPDLLHFRHQLEKFYPFFGFKLDYGTQLPSDAPTLLRRLHALLYVDHDLDSAYIATAKYTPVETFVQVFGQLDASIRACATY